MLPKEEQYIAKQISLINAIEMILDFPYKRAVVQTWREDWKGGNNKIHTFGFTRGSLSMDSIRNRRFIGIAEHQIIPDTLVVMRNEYALSPHEFTKLWDVIEIDLTKQY